MTFDFLPALALTFLLVFVRLGTMVMLMPGLGEQNIPTRVRLMIALGLTYVMLPLVASKLPAATPQHFTALLALIFGELIIGFFIGLATRLIMSAAAVAGTTIATQIGLAAAQTFNPAFGQQGALTANFIAFTTITMIFATDLHHMVIAALHDSYTMFPPTAAVPIEDLTQYAIMTVSSAFSLGVQMAAPFLAFGIIFNFGLGLLNRLMPQLQVFFVAMPANIAVGFMMLLALTTAIITWYVDHIAQAIGHFVGS